jgi:3',5'-nucleoside bisphosphate phosphatase
MGLKGIEVYYPEHPPVNTFRYESMARKYGLLMTGGTDFHGDVKPEIQMGSGRGDLHVPYHLFQNLNACLRDVETS